MSQLSNKKTRKRQRADNMNSEFMDTSTIGLAKSKSRDECDLKNLPFPVFKFNPDAYSIDPVTGKRAPLIPLDLKAINPVSKTIDPVTKKSVPLIPLNIKHSNSILKSTRLNDSKSKNGSGKKNFPFPVFDFYAPDAFSMDPVTEKRILRPLVLDMKSPKSIPQNSKSNVSKKIKSEPKRDSHKKNLFPTASRLSQTNRYSEFNKPKKIPKLEISPSKKSNSSKKKNVNFIQKSPPLLNLEDVSVSDVFKIDSPYNKVSPLKAQMRSIDIPESIKENEELQFKSNTPDSMIEFNEIEEICYNNYLKSPSTLLKNLTLNSVDKSKPAESLESKILKCIEEKQRSYEQLCTTLKINHEREISQLNQFLNSIRSNKNNTPTNSVRKSLRLQKKTPVSVGKKLFYSPTIEKTNDLRKTIFKKNLPEFTKVPNSSQLIQTPKGIRNVNNIYTPNTNTRLIQKQVSEQFITLLDTPR